MWNLKYNKNLSTKKKQIHRHREQICGCEQMQTIIYRMDKQQDPTVEHREVYSVS